MPFTVGVYFENSEKDRASFKTNTCLGWMGRCFEGMAEGFENLKIIDIPETAISSTYLPLVDLDAVRRLFGIPITNGYYVFCKYMERGYGPEEKGILFDSKAGVTPEHFAEMHSHFAKFPTVPNSEKYAIFDWDRTLTRIEGLVRFDYLDGIPFVSLEHPAKNERLFRETLMEDTLLFLLGGAERLAMIRREMQGLIDAGITVFILTRNGACGKPYFQTLMQTLHPYFAPVAGSRLSEYIVCGFIREGGYVDNFTKREALEQSPVWERRSLAAAPAVAAGAGASKKARGGHGRRRRRHGRKTNKIRKFRR